MPPLASYTVGGFLEALAARTPAPGGGAVAGVVLATAAALGRMVLAFTIGRARFATHDQDNRACAAALEELQQRALLLADADAEAYRRFNALQRLPADDPGRAAIPEALLAAIEPPLSLVELAAAMRRHLASLGERSNPLLASDLTIAQDLLETGFRAARRNVDVNLADLPAGPPRTAIVARLEAV